MSEYTPAQWKTNETIVYVEGEDEDFAICHTQAKDTNTLPYKTSLANARLIAAAPELLEALELIVGWHKYQSPAIDIVLDKCREVIAKAKGE